MNPDIFFEVGFEIRIIVVNIDLVHQIANFRNLNGTIVRMSTLAPGGRIIESIQQAEIETLMRKWHRSSGSNFVLTEVLSGEQLDRIDLFDRLQLEQVIRICRDSKSLSDAGRTLFSVSRMKNSRSNDADCLKKYLEKFDLSWHRVIR